MLIGKKKQMIEPRKNFTFRLSEEEREQVNKEAESNGLNPSEYVRELIIHGGRVDTSLKIDRRDIINQISRVGNNVNQLTHLANSERSVSNHAIMQVVGYMKEIRNLLMEVMNKWQ
ncbi:MAG: plasmid mobilization protein [Mobilitalea sp.]